MRQHSTEADRAIVQAALELRHDTELLAEHCRRLYERANRLVELTRHLQPATGDGSAAARVGVD